MSDRDDPQEPDDGWSTEDLEEFPAVQPEPDLTPEQIEALKASRVPLHVEEGKVVWFGGEEVNGKPEYERLARAGDLHEVNSYDGIARTETEKAKLSAMCRRSLFQLVKALSVECAGIPLDTFHDVLATGLAIVGANLTNAWNNDVQRNPVPFTIHGTSSRPWNFGLVGVTLGEPGAGKGIMQLVVENVASEALPVETAVDFSVPGFFGGHHVLGDAAERRRGVIEPTRFGGIVLIPEGEALAKAVASSGTFSTNFAEFTATWRVRRNLAKGIVDFAAWPSIFIALQLEAWTPLSTAVTKLDRRVFFNELPRRSTQQEAEAILRLEAGVPFDPEALEVVRAILRNRVREFPAIRIGIGRIVRWLADALKTPPAPGVRFRFQDAQRVVAIATGLWLVKLVGRIPAEVTIPSPSDDPDLMRIVVNDARIRARLSMPEEDARETEIVRRLRDDPVFLGTPGSPTAHSGPAWIAQIVRLTGMAPGTARTHFYGTNDRGRVVPSLVEQYVLTEVAAPVVRPESERLKEMARRRVHGRATPEEIAELNLAGQRDAAGRPPKYYAFDFDRSSAWEDG